jgi:transcriptional regulator with XRE-family HTH domain
MKVEIKRCLLQDILNEKKIDRSKLGFDLNMTRSQISDYANGRRVMSLQIARMFSKYLNVPIEDLYKWID